YGANPTAVIQGYDFQAMIAYQVWVLVIQLLGQGNDSMNLSEDIRLGRISSYLIYPFDFWKFHTAGFLAFQGMQFLLCTVLLCSVLAMGFLANLHFNALLQGVILTLLVGGLWFTLQYLVGLMAFWLEETWILRVILIIVAQFLSGAILPLELYPKWVQSALLYTPFPYLTYLPARVFMGDSGLFLSSLLVVGFWTLIMAGICTLVWKRGLRLYTAAGM
ncbi:hypothetical protein HOF92_09400, partial [bacterium]|nr:hypothetical protein [bacterium]